MTEVAPHIRAKQENMYGFRFDQTKSLKDEAARAAGLIYSTGILIVSDVVEQGVFALTSEFAAAAFDQTKLAALEADADPLAQGFADIIRSYQTFAESDPAQKDRQCLRAIHDKAEELQKQGWQPQNLPRRVKMRYA